MFESTIGIDAQRTESKEISVRYADKADIDRRFALGGKQTFDEAIHWPL